MLGLGHREGEETKRKNREEERKRHGKGREKKAEHALHPPP